MIPDPSNIPANTTAISSPPISSPQSDRPQVGSGVVDTAGLFGTVVSAHDLELGASGGLSSMIVVQHREQQLMLPSSVFRPVSGSSFSIPFAFSMLVSQDQADGKLVIPVLQEEVQVGKELVDSGRGLRVHKSIVETTQEFEQMLLQEDLTIEHVAQGTWIDADSLPVMREEGNVLIIPVIEEVPVIQTRLRLKEEVRITRTRRSTPATQTVVLKSEQVRIERFDENLQSDAAPGSRAGMMDQSGS